MDVRSAASLIRGAVAPGAATWADLGAGSGIFTLALASLLGPEGRVIAVDRDAAALATLEETVKRSAPAAEVLTLTGDFREPLELPRLDGILLANALHFVPANEQAAQLRSLVRHLRRDGRLVIVDYEGRRPNAWVPYPVSIRRLGEVLKESGLPPAAVLGQRPSMYGGRIYAAWTAVPRTGREA